MGQMDDGRMRQLFTEDDILDARARGEPIFREGDKVEVRNVSIPDQPVGRFVIILLRDDDMVLMGVPKAYQQVRKEQVADDGDE